MAKLKKPIIFPKIDASGEARAFGWATLYTDLQTMREEQWVKRAKAYEKAPDDFFRAWHWLQEHPIFYYFGREKRHEGTLCHERGVDEGLEFRPAMVNRVTRKAKGPMEDREVEIWVEVFPASMRKGALGTIRLHDYEIDTGAPTYEQAVIKVAELIYDRHGHDRVRLEKIWKGA